MKFYLAFLVCVIRALRYTQVWLVAYQLRRAEHRMRRAVNGIQSARNNQVAHQIKVNRLRGQLARTIRSLS